MSETRRTEIMSNELMIVLATASAAALIGGALVAWFTPATVPTADPDAEGRRELQLIELRETAEQCQQESRAAEQHARPSAPNSRTPRRTSARWRTRWPPTSASTPRPRTR